MNEDTLKGKWKQLEGELRTRWSNLTNDDIGAIEGNFEKLVGAVQERYGKSREEAEREVREWRAENA
jgi:uncharacterized protein YjbJ (UPF0337 family)